MKIRLAIAVITVICILLSCRQNQKESPQNIGLVNTDAQSKAPAGNTLNLNLSQDGVIQQNENENEKQEEREPGKQPDPIKKSPPPVPADWDKKIVKDANLEMRVKELKAANTAIQEAVRSSGAYISSASEIQLSTQVKTEMMIRVPRENFEELLGRLSGYADSIVTKNITSEDLTEEFVDTRARIQVKEKVKEQYYEFLKRAKNIEEILKVQHEITDLQEDIEAATGRVNYIQHQASLSSIHLTYYQDIPFTNTPNITPGFGLQILDSFKTGWTIIQSFIIILVTIWPFILTGIIVLVYLKKRKLNTVLNVKSK